MELPNTMVAKRKMKIPATKMRSIANKLIVCGLGTKWWRWGELSEVCGFGFDGGPLKASGSLAF